MKRFKSILLVYDAGPTGKAGLERATTLAEHNQTRLTVVEVIEQVPCGVRASKRIAEPPVRQVPLELVIEGEKEHLVQSMETLQAHGLHPDIRVLVGVPFLEITRKVLRDGHDLVIVPAEGNCGVRERLLGSPALHLMRTCPCPVWVLRSGRSQPHGGILAALDAEDGEEKDLNRKILDFAYCLAQWENSEIHVLHVTPTDEESLPRHHARVGQGSYQQLPLENCPRSQNRLDWRLAEYGSVSRTMHFYYLRGAAASLICRLAHDRQVGLIVMGTVRRPGASECVLGNTAETVLHQVSCSVMSVKPDSFVSPITGYADLQDDPTPCREWCMIPRSQGEIAVQLDVRLKGIIIDRALREQIVDHIDATFRRLSKRIRAVTVCLADTNGPRGGVDKNCRIVVQLHRGGTARSGRTDADLFTAVNLAADRVTHAVVRRLERRRKRAARTKSWTPGED